MITAPREWFKIANVSEESADVYLYDYIGYYGVTAAAFISQLSAITAKNINLHINSGGGSIFEGLAIYNGLVAHGATIRVFVDGIAASMASVIAMAGDEITVAENAFIMIHRASSDAYGTADDMRASAALLEQLEQSLIGIYAARTGQKPEDIFKAMQAETWMNATTALELGYATATTPSKKSAASNAVNISKFKNPPAALVDAGAVIEMEKQSLAPAAVPPVVAVVAPAPATAVLDPVAVAVEAANAEHAKAIAAVRTELANANAALVGFTAQLADKEKELVAAKAATAAAELLSAANLGVPPVNIAAPDAKPKSDAEHLAHYETLKGDARAAYYEKNEKAIWSAHSAR